MCTLLTLPDMKVYQRNLLWWNSSTLKPEFLPCVLLDQLVLPFTARPLSLVKPYTPNSCCFFSLHVAYKDSGWRLPATTAGRLLCGEREDTNNRLGLSDSDERRGGKRLFFALLCDNNRCCTVQEKHKEMGEQCFPRTDEQIEKAL